MTEVVSVVYVTDLCFDRLDPADLFDLAYLLRSPRYHVQAVCLTEMDGGAERVISELVARAGKSPAVFTGAASVSSALSTLDDPTNLIVVGGYESVVATLDADRAGFRSRAARCFVVGGIANDYTRGRAGERIPFDPRLRDRNPDRFTARGDVRAPDLSAWGRLLTSGEGIIWLPRDISLWRYAASGMLADGGPMCEFLLRETFAANLTAVGSAADRYAAWDTPVLLSSLPALLLAVEPDPFAWMRLFRAAPARVTLDEAGRVTQVEMPTQQPNLYTVVAIDGQALGKLLTAGLRDRPLGG